ncbi:hypothetical protein P4B35_23440, partial [Pontiellaceae bacterium B12227]|nr:hypothetical protein [Pontiellaceae bacterium B12227]
DSHMSYDLDNATAAFMYTLLSGRCPVVAEPADVGSAEWMQWLGHKVGYETAWQMSQLTTRVPGLRILPSNALVTTLSPGSTETLTVQFMYPPQADVTVTVNSSSATAAIVGPQTLTFTPENYNLPRQISLTALPGAAGSEEVNVVFSTQSDDEVFDNLSDSWGYTVTRNSPVTVTRVDDGVVDIPVVQYTPVDIPIDVVGATSGNTLLTYPAHGTVAWVGDGTLRYTPSSGYLGADQILYATTIGNTQTVGRIDLTVELQEGQVDVLATDASAAEEGLDTGTFTISRAGDTGSALDVHFTLGGTADSATDYVLSETSPVTIPAGQSSITITLTPVDDTVFAEDDDYARLILTSGLGYPVGSASADITILDNDNNAPVANAGPDQQAAFPAEVATGDPVVAPYFEWDAPSGSLEAERWSSTTSNTYDWVFDTATVPLSVWDSRFKIISGAYAFPSAKDGSSASFDSVNTSSEEPATFEMILDIDGLTGSIFETGGNGLGLQIDVNAGALRGTVMNGGGNTARASYTLAAADLERYLHIVFTVDHVNDIVDLYVDGELKDSQAWTNSDDWAGGDAGSLGSTSGTVPPGGAPDDFEGKIALFRFYKNKAFSAAEVAANFDALTALPGAFDILDGSGSNDPDGQPLTYLWEVVSGPGTVRFNDPTLAAPSVLFSEIGTYVLQLTVDDGREQATDQITIQVDLETAGNGPELSIGGGIPPIVQWDAVPGKTYRVWFKTNLLDSSWIDLGPAAGSADFPANMDAGFIFVEELP